MRVTDHRYSQEHRNLTLAMRMIRYEARTNTITAFTGLTDDRIRKLYQSYIAQEGSHLHIRRRRGKSPQQVERLIRNAATQQHASVLAGSFVSVGLIDGITPENKATDPCTIAERLCDAYDLYRHLVDEKRLSFEHAWFLWHTLEHNDELQLATCSACGGLILLDRYSVRPRPCPWCRTPM
jgi:hypothetical protein